MSNRDQLVHKEYQDLYADYYRSPNETLAKREISANQTVGYLTNVVGSKKYGKLLDVGAGDGNVLLELSRLQIADELYAVEISRSGIEAINARQLPTVRAAQLFDGYNIPYPDKYFDLAVAIHVLEHVEHERLLLREMGRIARNVYIEVPLEHGVRVRRAITNGRQFGHINFYTPETLRNLLESSGLKVAECRVGSSSLRYEQHVAGPVKGFVKNAVRNLALKISPKIAPWFIVYNGYAYCECS
jgi:SAM-dependent methyltransferase